MSNTYASPAGRINEVKGEMLKITEPAEVLQLGCEMKRMPRNKGDNITYRGVIPTGGSTTSNNTINRWSVTAANFQVGEGITPLAQALDYRDVAVSIAEYAVLFSYTNKVALLHEDDIPADQMRQTALLMGLVREMVRYGVMKAANRPATAPPIATTKPVAGLDYYFDAATGLLVFTAHYLARRGFCCGNGCRHCPYPKEKE